MDGTNFELVGDFMESMEQDVRIKPSFPDEGIQRLRLDLIEEELEKGVAHEKITVAGFSQGGVIALESGLVAERKFAGIMALSTYVNNHEELTQRVALANLDTKIFMAHGLADPMIPITRAVTSREKLLELGYKVEWHEYSMGHQVCPQEIKDLETWLKSIYED